MNNVSANRAKTFLDTHVLPNVSEWRKSALDLRLAMNAAVSLNQMADYFWHQFFESEPDRVFAKSDVGAFRRELATRHPSFGLIRDVADAHKHLKLNRNDRVLTSAGQTVLGSLGFGEAEYGLGSFGGSEEVVIELDSGQRRHFSGILEDVVAMWEAMLSGRV